jgi:hypothetical protein
LSLRNGLKSWIVKRRTALRRRRRKTRLPEATQVAPTERAVAQAGTLPHGAAVPLETDEHTRQAPAISTIASTDKWSERIRAKRMLSQAWAWIRKHIWNAVHATLSIGALALAAYALLETHKTTSFQLCPVILPTSVAERHIRTDQRDAGGLRVEIPLRNYGGGIGFITAAVMSPHESESRDRLNLMSDGERIYVSDSVGALLTTVEFDDPVWSAVTKAGERKSIKVDLSYESLSQSYSGTTQFVMREANMPLGDDFVEWELVSADPKGCPD